MKSIGTAACAGAANGFVSGLGDRGDHRRSSKGRLRRDGKGCRNGIEGRERHRVTRRANHGDVPKLHLVASGQIEPVEMASNMGQSVLSTVMMLGGAAVATALTGGATLPALIGSFVGGAAGSMAFKPVSSCVMKVCVDSGVTFFGLVEQDYEVPKRLLSMLGIKGARIKTARRRRPAFRGRPNSLRPR